MTSVADEGHLDPLAETSQRRSCQELRCLCKGTFECAYIMKISVFCVRALVFRLCFLHASIYQSAVLGSLWHCYVLPGDDEKLGAVISYGCQILGRAPYHLPLTYWDGVLDHASSLIVT